MIIYTDGSIIKKKRGIGIYDSYNKTTYSYNIGEHLSIKSIETLAILEAIKIAKMNKITEITIITDSLSACKSITNYNSGNHNKYFEWQILKIIREQNINLQIIWIPSHIGIEGNEEADKAARYGTKSRRTIETKTPIEDNINLFKEKMYEKWNIEFLNRTITKGNQHSKNINGKVIKKPWFHKQNMDSGTIKRLTRLRTNHTYDKKYLKLIKKIDDDTCETCNVREDARHTIEQCKKHDNIRNKFNTILNKKIEDILAKNRIEEYKELNEFLKQIKKQIKKKKKKTYY